MCVLGIFFTWIAVCMWRPEFFAKLTFNITADISSSNISNTYWVGSHISNQTDRTFFAHSNTFVQLLSYHHRLFGSKIQTFNSLLLQAAGSKRRQRITFTLFFCCFFNDISSFSQSFFYNSRFLSSMYFQFFAQMFDNLCFKNRSFSFFTQFSIQSPIFFRNEISDFFFTVSNDFYCYRLYTSGTQAFSYFTP